MSYTLTNLRLSELQDRIINELRKGLPEGLFYHCPEHTLDVLSASRRIAKAEGLDSEKLSLLEAAALLHDTGFLFVYQNHEESSIRFARKILPEYGFPEESLDPICEAIMATKIPQCPTNEIGRILCDADLDYLGRSDFWEIGETLFNELMFRNAIQGREDWNRIQVRFLESQAYWTETNQRDREPQKQKYLQELKAIVATYPA